MFRSLQISALLLFLVLAEVNAASAASSSSAAATGEIIDFAVPGIYCCCAVHVKLSVVLVLVVSGFSELKWDRPLA